MRSSFPGCQKQSNRISIIDTHAIQRNGLNTRFQSIQHFLGERVALILHVNGPHCTETFLLKHAKSREVNERLVGSIQKNLSSSLECHVPSGRHNRFNDELAYHRHFVSRVHKEPVDNSPNGFSVQLVSKYRLNAPLKLVPRLHIILNEPNGHPRDNVWTKHRVLCSDFKKHSLYCRHNLECRLLTPLLAR